MSDNQCGLLEPMLQTKWRCICEIGGRTFPWHDGVVSHLSRHDDKCILDTAERLHASYHNGCNGRVVLCALSTNANGQPK